MPKYSWDGEKNSRTALPLSYVMGLSVATLLRGTSSRWKSPNIVIVADEDGRIDSDRWSNDDVVDIDPIMRLATLLASLGQLRTILTKKVLSPRPE